ncbi:MAG: zinc ribbon domain-containing protein [Methanobacterium sp.]|nr:zinc ribbon domain-containing protein [Methanobacterium sp.]
MVTNEEIRQMLDAKRKGINTEYDNVKSTYNKICPHCKNKNPEKALFCVHCGRKFDKNLQVPCQSCGLKNATTATFCVGCGGILEKIDKKIVTPNNIEKSGIDTLERPVKKDVPSSIPEHNILSKTSLKKTCYYCNGKNLKNAKFCVVCGKKFDANKTESQVKINETSTENPIINEELSDSPEKLNKIPVKTPSPQIPAQENVIPIKNMKTKEVNKLKDAVNIENNMKIKNMKKQIQ